MKGFLDSNHKIGYAGNPEWRLGELQVGSPFPLRLVRTWTGSKKIEKHVHAIVNMYRIHGEWFLLPKEFTTATGFRKIVGFGYERDRLHELSKRLVGAFFPYERRIAKSKTHRFHQQRLAEMQNRYTDPTHCVD